MAVQGRRIDLSDGRIVFLGADTEQPDRFFIGLRNAQQEDTKLTLSREAMAALVSLYNNEDTSLPLMDFPHQRVWKLVVERDAS